MRSDYVAIGVATAAAAVGGWRILHRRSAHAGQRQVSPPASLEPPPPLFSLSSRVALVTGGGTSPASLERADAEEADVPAFETENACAFLHRLAFDRWAAATRAFAVQALLHESNFQQLFQGYYYSMDEERKKERAIRDLQQAKGIEELKMEFEGADE